MIFNHHHPNSLICREPAKYSQVVQSLKEGKGVIQIAVEQGRTGAVKVNRPNHQREEQRYFALLEEADSQSAWRGRGSAC